MVCSCFNVSLSPNEQGVIGAEFLINGQLVFKPLKSASVHLGGANFGHYVTYKFEPNSQYVTIISDSCVFPPKQLTSEQLLELNQNCNLLIF